MTINEFKSSPDRVKALREALEQPILIEAMMCLNVNAPVNISVMPNISDTFANIRLGDALGYARYPRILKFLATHATATSTENLDNTYEPAEE